MSENLYIQVDSDGNHINHPALESNLIQVFGSIPSDWEPFVRIEAPATGVYETIDMSGLTYRKIDGVWKDVWTVKQMTQAEKKAKQRAVKEAMAARRYAHNWAAWKFDEDTCSYIPPIPRPPKVEGKMILWCGAQNNWREAPLMPDDGKSYRFNFDDWVWIESI